MATWTLTNATGISAADADLGGEVLLSGTIPGDFNRQAVTSVRFQYSYTLSGISDDSWVESLIGVGLESSGGTILAGVVPPGGTFAADQTYPRDLTDLGHETVYDLSLWSGSLYLRPATVFATFNRNMGADGATLSLHDVTVTVEYTAGGPPALSGTGTGISASSAMSGSGNHSLISFRGSDSYSETTTASALAHYPDALPGDPIQSGDLLLAWVWYKHASTFPLATCTPPAGWTKIYGREGGNWGAAPTADTGNVVVACYFKIADGTETGTATFTMEDHDLAITTMHLWRLESGDWDMPTFTLDGFTPYPMFALQNSDPGGQALSLTTATTGSPTHEVKAGDVIAYMFGFSTDEPTAVDNDSIGGPAAFATTPIGFYTSGTSLDGGVRDGYASAQGDGTAAVTWSADVTGATTNMRGPWVAVRLRKEVPSGTGAITASSSMSSTGSATIRFEVDFDAGADDAEMVVADYPEFEFISIGNRWTQRSGGIAETDTSAFAAMGIHLDLSKTIASMRYYYRRIGTPVGDAFIDHTTDHDGNDTVSQLRHRAGGEFQVRDKFVGVYTTAETVGNNEWVRVERRWNGPSNTQDIRLFYGPNVNGTVPDVEQTGIDMLQAAAPTTPISYRMGTLAAAPTQTLQFYGLAYSDDGTQWIGPKDGAILPPDPPQASGTGTITASSSLSSTGTKFETTPLPYTQDFESFSLGTALDDDPAFDAGFDVFCREQDGSKVMSPEPAATGAAWLGKNLVLDSTFFISFDLYMLAWPTALQYMVWHNSNANEPRLYLDNSPQGLYAQITTDVATALVPLALNTWYSVVWTYDGITNSLSVTPRAGGATTTETVADTIAVNMTEVRFGHRYGNLSDRYYIDNIVVDAAPPPSGTGAITASSSLSSTGTKSEPTAPQSSGIVVWDGAATVEGTVYVWDGSQAVLAASARAIPAGYSSVSHMLASEPFYWAHRGGSAVFPEMSLYAYTRSVDWGYGALEVSLARTSDGVWFGLHDQTLLRTSGADVDPSTMTWAQVQAYQIDYREPAQPYMRLETLLEAYGGTHVIILDPKHALAQGAELLDLALGYVPSHRLIAKYSGMTTNTSFASAAHERFIKTWGYFYEADIASVASKEAQWDMLGIDHGASQATYDTMLSFGKPLIAHVVASRAAADAAIAKGANGIQTSGVTAVLDREPFFAPAPSPVAVGASTEGYVLGTSFSVTLPTGWDATGAMVLLFVQRNDAQLAMTADSGVTLTTITTGSMQRVFQVVDPAASFTVTVPSSNHNRWVAVVLENASAAVGVGGGGSSTTSVIEGLYIGHGFAATGDEVLLTAGGTNSTAVWTGPAGWTELYVTPSGVASIGVWHSRPVAASEGTTVPDMDRGNDGVTRNESVTAVLVSG